MPWSLPLSMGSAAPPWGHSCFSMGCWCGTAYKGVRPAARAVGSPQRFPVPSLSPYVGASSTISWGTSACFALPFAPKHLGCGKRYYCSSVKMFATANAEGWMLMGLPPGAAAVVFGASRHKLIPAQPHVQGACRAVIATWEKGAGSRRVALRLQIVSVCMEQGVWCKTAWDWAMDGPLICLSSVTWARGDQPCPACPGTGTGCSWPDTVWHLRCSPGSLSTGPGCPHRCCPLPCPEVAFLPSWVGTGVVGLCWAVPQSPQLPVPPLSLPAPNTKSNFSRVTSPYRSQAHVKGPVSEQERTTKSLFM